MKNRHGVKHGRPEEYRGPLTLAEATAGMNAALRNAQLLLADAKLLLNAERYPTATALAALSIEESGKVSILRGLVLETTPDGLRKQWGRYRDHRSKNGAWIMPDLVAKGARLLHELSEVVNRDGEHTAILNTVKQIGFYTDCYTKGYWSEPEKVIEVGLARSVVQIAEIMAAKETVTEREIELWVEFLGPVWRTPEMPFALLRWATAMHTEGLSTISPGRYAQFVFGEVTAADRSSEPPEA